MSAPGADETTVRAFLELRYGDLEAGWFHLFAEDRGKRTRRVLWYDVAAPGVYERAAREAVKFTTAGTRWNVWASVNVYGRDHGPHARGGVEDVTAVLAFGADIDVGKPGTPESVDEALVFVTALPLPPSLITCSGGGVQAYWTFREPLTIDTEGERDELRSASVAWGRAVNTWARPHGWTFDSVFDLSRILRVPGTLNHKEDTPRAASTLHEGDERYNLTELLEVIPEAAWAPLADAPAPEEGERVLQADELETLADVFAPAWRDGTRHSMALHVSGHLANKGIAESSALELVRLCSSRAGDEHTDRKLQNVRTSYRLLREGKRPAGFSALRELLTPDALATLDRTFPSARVTANAPEPVSVEPVQGFRLTDLGNAERFIHEHGRNLRYSFRLGSWLVWDGTRWQPDEGGALVHRLAVTTVRDMYRAAGELDDEKERKALATWAAKTEDRKRLTAFQDLARLQEGVDVQVENLDPAPWLLNVLNGTLDLRTGELRPHRREDMLTKLVRVTYDPQARAPRWEAFLHRIMDGDAELVAFLQRAAGYSLTGITSERAAFILHGDGQNGKSTFVQTLRDVLGDDYSARTPTETLLVRRETGVPNDLARLRGARLVAAAEADEGRRLDEARLKDLTGREAITARFMRAEWFEFLPQFKLWLSTNHRPVIRGTDRAIWDRIRLVPFTVRIPDEERDLELPDKLRAEASGILAWAVEGCLAWQRDGLGAPDAVKAATEDYRTEQDVLGGFLRDSCILEESASVAAKSLYASYVQWCEDMGERPISQTMVGKRLRERGLESVQAGNDRARTWRGVGLIATPTLMAGTKTYDGRNGTRLETITDERPVWRD